MDVRRLISLFPGHILIFGNAAIDAANPRITV
jgi:hypothetical protein